MALYINGEPQNISGGTYVPPASALYDLGGSTALWRDIWNSRDVNIYSDAGKLKLGAGQDAALYYDGTHLYIDPKEVGSGRVKILGDLDLQPDAESGTPSTTGAWFDQTAQTFTDNVTAAAGTVAAMVYNSFKIPIFDALNGAAGANRVTVTNAATVYIAGPPAPVTDKTLITNPWALEIAAGNVRIVNFSIGTGTSGAYGFIGVTSAGPILGEGSSASTGIYIRPLSGHYIYADQGAGLQLIGGGRLLASSATEIGLQVTNGALTVGSEGSIEAPYLSQAAAAFTDAIGGNLNGCIGINHDSSPGADTIEVRVEGAWLSVAVAGYLIQNTVPYIASPDIWVHPNQVRGEQWLDETICVVCGEQLRPKDAISMYGNYWAGKRGLHAIFGHQHLERDPLIAELQAQIWAQGEEIKELKQQLLAV